MVPTGEPKLLVGSVPIGELEPGADVVVVEESGGSGVSDKTAGLESGADVVAVDRLDSPGVLDKTAEPETDTEAMKVDGMDSPGVLDETAEVDSARLCDGGHET